MKRILDIVGAVVLLFLLSPIMILTMLAVRYWLGSPVLVLQRRPGLLGRSFFVMKFRSMLDARTADGALLSDSERLTSFGRFLRSTSLDELPQLWNVLKGDMSFVGPRPLLTEYLPLYSPEQRRRHEVRPGITGWAQVNGRNSISWEEKFSLDIWYVDNQTMLLDARIVLITLGCLTSRRNINNADHATMPRFRGNEPHTTHTNTSHRPNRGEEQSQRTS